MFLLDFFYPKFCVNCGSPGNYLCTQCSYQLEPIKSQECHVCRVASYRGFLHRDCGVNTYLDGVIACYRYSDVVSKLMQLIKYQGVYDLAKLLAWLMLVQLNSYQLPTYFVTAVPLSKYKWRKRGYNQSKEIAINLGSDFYYRELLLRQQNRLSQVGQGRVERLTNLRGSFICKSNSLPSRVLLVDDVMTTGATLEECARCLKNAGIKEVYALVFARA